VSPGRGLARTRLHLGEHAHPREGISRALIPSRVKGTDGSQVGLLNAASPSQLLHSIGDQAAGAQCVGPHRSVELRVVAIPSWRAASLRSRKAILTRSAGATFMANLEEL
jgi:hypothetical protein